VGSVAGVLPTFASLFVEERRGGHVALEQVDVDAEGEAGEWWPSHALTCFAFKPARESMLAQVCRKV
jgi:hypothetical protein